MKNKKWNALSNDELLKSQKSLKAIAYMLTAALHFLFYVVLFLNN
jgi:hypothetical protein